VLLAVRGERLMPGPAGVWCCEPREPSVARATAAITPKLQIARTQSRPPNSRRFDSKQNAFAAIEENRLIETIAAQAPAQQGPQG
jgi:hypothetical protein